MSSRTVSRQLSYEELGSFFENIAMMLKAGITAEEAVDLLNEEKEGGDASRRGGAIAEVTSHMAEKMAGGMSLGGAMEEWVAAARRKGDEWWAGAITDWSPRTLALDTSFLGSGEWNVEILTNFIHRIPRVFIFKSFSKTFSTYINVSRWKEKGFSWKIV